MLRGIPELLRSEGRHGALADAVSWRFLVPVIVLGTMAYGAAMGSYGPRPLQIAYSALKVPMLVAIASLISLPSFFVLNTVLGLREDFAAACRAVLAAQASLAVALASLAPLTSVIYVSSDDYPFATAMNGGMFAIATAGGHVTLLRHYRVLVARNPRHRVTLVAWLLLYVFVSIQMAWVLRPFVGAPSMPTRFFREGAWGNAYVEVAGVVARVLGVR
jgi:hypothetical protein